MSNLLNKTHRLLVCHTNTFNFTRNGLRVYNLEVSDGAPAAQDADPDGDGLSDEARVVRRTQGFRGKGLAALAVAGKLAVGTAVLASPGCNFEDDSDTDSFGEVDMGEDEDDAGDGDGDPDEPSGGGDGDGDGDTSPETGDGDGDGDTGPETGDGDGDGDETAGGDGDGDMETTGDGDGDPEMPDPGFVENSVEIPGCPEEDGFFICGIGQPQALLFQASNLEEAHLEIMNGSQVLKNGTQEPLLEHMGGDNYKLQFIPNAGQISVDLIINGYSVESVDNIFGN